MWADRAQAKRRCRAERKNQSTKAAAICPASMGHRMCCSKVDDRNSRLPVCVGRSHIPNLRRRIARTSQIKLNYMKQNTAKSRGIPQDFPQKLTLRCHNSRSANEIRGRAQQSQPCGNGGLFRGLPETKASASSSSESTEMTRLAGVECLSLHS